MSDKDAGPSTCSRCGKPLRKVSAFCPSCGAPTAVRLEKFRREQRQEDARVQSTVRVLGLIFGGTLGAVFLVGLLYRWTELGTAPGIALQDLLLLGVGLGAAVMLGPGGLRETLPWRTGPAAAGWGVAGGGAVAAVSFLWVTLLKRVFPDPGSGAVEVEAATPLVLALVLFAVLPALIEEWLCRGVLWRALEKETTPGVTIVATAVLFGFLHGMNGAYLLEVPHRFAAGLVLGLLRRRTGGLAAPVLAHFLNNTLWTVLDAVGG